MGHESKAKSALKAETPREAMNMGKPIKLPNEWYYNRGRRIMHEALIEKFKQEEMRDYLLSASGVIGEATKHPYFGIGHYLNDSQSLHVQEWTGSNILGELLTEIWDDIMARL